MRFNHRAVNIPVDINQYPNTLDSNSSEMTIGDINGNALFLLNTLIRVQAVWLSTANYECFKALYCKDFNSWSEKDFQNLNAILDSLKVYDHRKLRFLGDIFADRGNNDFMTLKLLAEIDAKGLDYNIVLSNHDTEFFSYIEQTNFFHSHYESTLGNAQETTRSLQTLISRLEKSDANQHVIKDELDATKLKTLVQKALYRHIKAIDYSFSGEWRNKRLAIFTHAPYACNLIVELAQELGLSFDTSSVDSIENGINRINKKIADELCQGNLIHLLPELFPSKNEKNVDVSKKGASALSRLLWNRDFSDLDFAYSAFIAYFIHGHEKDHGVPGVYSLDNIVGKKDQGTLTLWTVDCQSRKPTTIVDTSIKQTTKRKQIFCIDQSIKKGRFTINPGTIEVPLSEDIDIQVAQKRLKTLYRYKTELTPEQALLITSPFFNAVVDKISKGVKSEYIVTPALLTPRNE